MTKEELDTLIILLDKFDYEYLTGNVETMSKKGAIEAKYGLQNLYGFLAGIEVK